MPSVDPVDLAVFLLSNVIGIVLGTSLDVTSVTPTFHSSYLYLGIHTKYVSISASLIVSPVFYVIDGLAINLTAYSSPTFNVTANVTSCLSVLIVGAVDGVAIV